MKHTSKFIFFLIGSCLLFSISSFGQMLHVVEDLDTNDDVATKIDYTHSIFSGITTGLLSESSPLTIKGQSFGVRGITSSTYSSKQGSASGILGLSKIFDGDGSMIGVVGSAVSSVLTNFNSKHSKVTGGTFNATGDNLTLGSGNFLIAGVEATVRGVINNTPSNGAVAAVYGVDDNQGTAESWAGYFVGKGHFSDKLTIGTTTIPASISGVDFTDYNLFVCGGILADEWMVPGATWCDYVFEKDYDLFPLSKVAQHIEEKGHLHNTPSAKEIEEDGLEVGAITINQQEKIEELFLHMIEMDKRMKALEADNATLKATNQLLEQKVAGMKKQLK